MVCIPPELEIAGTVQGKPEKVNGIKMAFPNCPPKANSAVVSDRVLTLTNRWAALARRERSRATRVSHTVKRE